MEDYTEKKEKRYSFPLPLVSKRVFVIVVLLSVLLGVGGGYFYYSLIGCTSGSCALKSSPYFNMIIGGLIGYLIPDLLLKTKE